MDDRRIREWERRTSVPLMATSMLFLTAYAVLVLDHGLSPDARDAWWAVLGVAWAVFVVDYLVRLALSTRRLRFVVTRWLDLVVLVLPLLRPLRVVRTYTRAQLSGHGGRLRLEAQVMAYTGLTTLLLGFAGSLAVYHVEHGRTGANIRTYGDAVWYTCSTLTAVGYGDVFPVTARGRLIGVGLMVIGLGLLGSVVGTFSSWLVGRFREISEAERPPGRD
ncbi:potassium channel family protein [Streptomyces sp. ICBB 8177]|uniref:potassium channel family protein n=1 Tax=Streptomyces sp. ICBB 8177 TaxID=563922 RepID=UPI000D6810E8|nr:potassium channel family protein [Streptomyces sp. ICBB 8177]PWI42061.1 ion transporter [Streptomyces sp. ICBB 8177]